MGENGTFAATAAALAELGRHAYARGWVLGTSGNFSAVVSEEPLRLAITSTGADKGRLDSEQILEIDARGVVLRGSGRPSAETAVHLTLVGSRGARAVLHTHSTWSTLLSDLNASAGGLVLEGYEMLKGLSGVRSHEHREWLPIIENAQDWSRQGAEIERLLTTNASAHGFLIRRHGLYTWGRDLTEAARHLEVLEFLLEVRGRSLGAPGGR